ncbi:hypothetical protein EU642_22155 [Salmonella enterica]|nr:hypothetical protein [Salmonella enterica]EAO0118558.1 hypothetical protein [Salmonella enterica]EAO3601662.1 hypothetical protein [Salmonella enterica]EAR6391556.1 hypothetical protein [Salmonella enterica]EAV1285320.1 hypothetical protein [Salmonella enterica]
MSIRTAPIERTRDGFYRRVDHENGLASTGFKTPDQMESNTEILRDGPNVEPLMRERYQRLFPAN